LALDPRGSPGRLRCSSVNAPVAVPGLVQELTCITTPTSERGVAVVCQNLVVNAL
jgi:hypothetical protein